MVLGHEQALEENVGLQSPPLSSYPDLKATDFAPPGTHTLIAVLAPGPQKQGNGICEQKSPFIFRK